MLCLPLPQNITNTYCRPKHLSGGGYRIILKVVRLNNPQSDKGVHRSFRNQKCKRRHCPCLPESHSETIRPGMKRASTNIPLVCHPYEGMGILSVSRLLSLDGQVIASAQSRRGNRRQSGFPIITRRKVARKTEQQPRFETRVVLSECLRSSSQLVAHGRDGRPNLAQVARR